MNWAGWVLFGLLLLGWLSNVYRVGRGSKRFKEAEDALEGFLSVLLTLVFVGLFGLLLAIAVGWTFNWAAWVLVGGFAYSLVMAIYRIAVGKPAKPGKRGWAAAGYIALSTLFSAGYIALLFVATGVLS